MVFRLCYRQHYPHASSLVMGILSNPVVPTSDAYNQHRTVLCPPGSSTAPFSPPPPVLPPKRRKHKKGNSSVTSIAFLGESHWGSRTPKLVSLEVASRTPSITKRGFECMYHKSHGNRLTGGSLYFGPVRKSQRDVVPRGLISTCLDPDAVLLPSHVACITSGLRENHDNSTAVGICGDSTKKLLKAVPLISLEEAKQREVSRRDQAAKVALEEEIQVEHEVRRLKREVAEIVRRKEQAKREEEERLARLKTLLEEEALGKRKRQGEPSLTAAVAAREGGLVVAPTNWIVPLISLDQARHTEKAKRDAVNEPRPAPHWSPPPPHSAAASVDSLKINAGNGSIATLRLVSLGEAAMRDRARRLEEDATDAIESRTQMLAHAGTGLSHVPLITLAEAHKQDALRRSHDEDRAIDTDNGDRRTKDAAAPQEKARWIALMSNTGNWWARPNAASDCSSDCSGPAIIARTPMGIHDWV